MSQEKNYYTTIESAKLLGVSVRTIQLWVENGSLNGWKTAGGHRRIYADSVDQKLREQDPNYHADDTPPDTNTNKRVLIVEDNPTVSVFYKAAFDSWGLPLDVHTADDGFHGLIKIGELSPDIVITDIYMPGMDGLQMIQTLYKSQSLDPGRLIVISGLDDEAIAERGGIPSGVEFYRKPVDVNELKNYVIAQLNLNETIDQL